MTDSDPRAPGSSSDPQPSVRRNGPAEPPVRAEASFRALFQRIWRGIVHNRVLVAAVLVLGFVEAFCTKAPLAMVKVLMDALGAQREGWFERVGKSIDHGAARVAGWWKRLVEGVPAPEPGLFDRWSKALDEGFHAAFYRFAHAVNDLLGLGFEGRMVSFLGIAAATVVLALVGGLSIYGMTVMSRYLATKIVVDLRNEVVDHILCLPLRFFSRRRMGELISNITNDTAVLTRSFTLACDHVVVDPLSILFNFLLLLAFVPEVAWWMLPAVPLMAWPMLRTGKRVHRSSSKSLAAMGDSTESMNQILTGIRTVKAFQLEGERLQEYRDSNRRYLHREKRLLQAKGFSQGFMFGAYQASFAIFLCVLGWWMTNSPETYTLSTIAMVVVPLATTYNHVKRMVRSFNILSESVGALEGIHAILHVDPDASTRRGGLLLGEVRGELAMENVSFAYDSEKVLDDLTLRVAPGETVALVGPTGAGKSTAMDLLARFHDPTSGRVLVDGHDLRGVDLQSYRRHVAVVSQQPFLFNTTVFDNILFGRRDATAEEVYEAARQAQIHDFIETLPNGYQTVVGEGGGRLSGGQRQRITIARAIVRNPRILFLDEATASLDSESEQAVQAAIENLMRGRTSIVIAHRLSTIRDADRILVMDGGRLVEVGTHTELIERGGLYRRLYDLQDLG
ncbi:MAG: ABC transporter ATP-binding protein [Planctomycetes bacterium]|nr:ABC transporter ATP-binding protein [Planctomycetota bacterium]MCB9869807.1 ABC transporter ATP-binding protein [Planctomycetota bacterium]